MLSLTHTVDFNFWNTLYILISGTHCITCLESWIEVLERLGRRMRAMSSPPVLIDLSEKLKLCKYRKCAKICKNDVTVLGYFVTITQKP
jgi:hypothetical protein